MDFVELVLDVDVFALAPWVSVDCMPDWSGIVAERSWLFILVGFQSFCCLTICCDTTSFISLVGDVVHLIVYIESL